MFWRPNNFFFSTLFDTSFDVYKVELVCLQICRQFPGFLYNSIRVYSIKLKIGMPYQKNNTFWSTILLDISQCAFKAMFVLSVLKNFDFSPKCPGTHKKGSKILRVSDQTDFTIFEHSFCKDKSILKTRYQLPSWLTWRKQNEGKVLNIQ